MVATQEEKAGEFLASVVDIMSGENGGWLFGENPTALDAHLVPFLARMTDVGRTSLLPLKLREYAAWATQRHEWKRMMNGMSTMAPPPPS
jgi:glutathione S-transferase